MPKSYYQRREDEVKILIARAKVRNNLTDAQLAKKIGMPHSTFGKQKLHPGRMRLDFLWAIERMAGGREEGIADVRTTEIYTGAESAAAGAGTGACGA